MGRGFQLFGETFEMLKKDREMLIFPILSGFVTLLVLATFLLPLFFSGILAGVGTSGSSPLAYVLLFAFYVVSYFIVICFNTALVRCALICLDGRDLTFMGGIYAASARMGKILSWALIAATVGLISAFLTGVVVSFIELPCTGGVYLAILAMLSGLDVWATTAILPLYNSMFVLPLIAIIIAAAAGFPPEQLTVIRLECRQYLRRVGGCVLILLEASFLLFFSV